MSNLQQKVRPIFNPFIQCNLSGHANWFREMCRQVKGEPVIYELISRKSLTFLLIVWQSALSVLVYVGWNFVKISDRVRGPVRWYSHTTLSTKSVGQTKPARSCWRSGIRVFTYDLVNVFVLHSARNLDLLIIGYYLFVLTFFSPRLKTKRRQLKRLRKRSKISKRNWNPLKHLL